MDSTSYYLYNPSKPLAGVCAGLFGLSFLVTLYQIIRKKAWVWIFMLLAIASMFNSNQSFSSHTDKYHSGGCRLHSQNQVCLWANREEAIRASIYPHHPTSCLDGRCHLCRLRKNCVLGCPARVKNSALPLGPSWVHPWQPRPTQR